MGLGGQAHTLEDELDMMEDDLDMMEDDPKMYKIYHHFKLSKLLLIIFHHIEVVFHHIKVVFQHI